MLTTTTRKLPILIQFERLINYMPFVSHGNSNALPIVQGLACWSAHGQRNDWLFTPPKALECLLYYDGYHLFVKTSFAWDFQRFMEIQTSLIIFLLFMTDVLATSWRPSTQVQTRSWLCPSSNLNYKWQMVWLDYPSKMQWTYIPSISNGSFINKILLNQMCHNLLLVTACHKQMAQAD